MDNLLPFLAFILCISANAVDGLRCRWGSWSPNDVPTFREFDDFECDQLDDQCAEVVLEGEGASCDGMVMKGCARAGWTCADFAKANAPHCEVANCSLCQGDLCNRKFEDGPICHYGNRDASGLETFEVIGCEQGQQCLTTVFAEPCNNTWVENATIEKGCIEANWTDHDEKEKFSGCKVANWTVCPDDLCNAEPPFGPSSSTGPPESTVPPESSSKKGVTNKGTESTTFGMLATVGILLMAPHHLRLLLQL